MEPEEWEINEVITKLLHKESYQNTLGKGRTQAEFNMIPKFRIWSWDSWDYKIIRNSQPLYQREDICTEKELF